MSSFREIRALSVLVAAVASAACGSTRAQPTLAPEPLQAKPLTATRFVAFGDSITEGFLQVCPDAPPAVMPDVESPRATQGLRQEQWSPIAYPARLQALLMERYPEQKVEVVNEGVGGEVVETGSAELSRVLIGDNPEVLLLLEGINDINFRHRAAIADVIEHLRSMVQLAKRRGVVVFVGTLLPQREGSCRARDASDSVNDIIPANAAIRKMVGEEGAILVDLYRVFSGRREVLLGPDGLHPSVAGYQAIADAFFDAIRRHLEEE